VACGLLLPVLLLSNCREHGANKREQLRADDTGYYSTADTAVNSVKRNLTLAQLNSTPNAVILTGLPEHRLLSVYKTVKETTTDNKMRSFFKSSYAYTGGEYEREEHFMPGIDILHGYNLINIGHYNLKTEKMNLLFKKPAFIKSLYYPAYIQDSVDKKPLVRDYLLISVYDKDTNHDTLINTSDLRSFYHVNMQNDSLTSLLPADYSVIRSQYDAPNDVMYLFASYDVNKNGMRDAEDPVHVFWIDLKAPAPAKRFY
jgi:hypothetical protein